MKWKVGDWAVFDRDIVQIKEVYEHGGCAVSTGMIETSGNLFDRLRPLTLRNKAAAEYFDYYYGKLSEINGERGFNYPDISRHFSELMLCAIDGPLDNKDPFDKAVEFFQQARDRREIIQGIQLFR